MTRTNLLLKTNRKPEGTAGSYFAFYSNLTAAKLGELLADGKAQSSSPMLSCITAIYLYKD